MSTESKPRVLAVDDSDTSLALLRRHLERSGYEVTGAPNGRQALRVLQEEGIQLVVTDWMMPEMDGLELCRAVRALDSVSFVYVIVLTAHTDKERLVEAFEAGADDYVTKPFDHQELVARLRAGQRIIALEQGLAERTVALHKVNAELAVANEKLELMATTDELTGLVNRRHALAKLEEHWALTSRHGYPLSCVMLDIDHFKSFNDTYGHAAGDLVLRRTASRLQRQARLTDVVSRLGGEEFLLICPHTTAESATALAERCRTAIESMRVHYEGHELNVTVSAGVARRQAQTRGPDDLIKAADEALYAAKRAGRNRVHVAAEPGAVPAAQT